MLSDCLLLTSVALNTIQKQLTYLNKERPFGASGKGVLSRTDHLQNVESQANLCYSVLFVSGTESIAFVTIENTQQKCIDAPSLNAGSSAVSLALVLKMFLGSDALQDLSLI